MASYVRCRPGLRPIVMIAMIIPATAKAAAASRPTANPSTWATFSCVGEADPTDEARTPAVRLVAIVTRTASPSDEPTDWAAVSSPDAGGATGDAGRGRGVERHCGQSDAYRDDQGGNKHTGGERAVRADSGKHGEADGHHARPVTIIGRGASRVATRDPTPEMRMIATEIGK